MVGKGGGTGGDWGEGKVEPWRTKKDVLPPPAQGQTSRGSERVSEKGEGRIYGMDSLSLCLLPQGWILPG
jgi:hypothetical protein